MKNFLLKILLSKAGPYVTGAISSGIGYAVASVAEYGVAITPEQTNEVAVWISGTIFTVAQSLLLGKQAAGVKAVQEVLRVPVDGVAGEVTFEGAKDAVVSPARKLPLGGPGK